LASSVNVVGLFLPGDGNTTSNCKWHPGNMGLLMAFCREASVANL
jgi:hypothetical protein